MLGKHKWFAAIILLLTLLASVIGYKLYQRHINDHFRAAGIEPKMIVFEDEDEEDNDKVGPGEDNPKHHQWTLAEAQQFHRELQKLKHHLTSRNAFSQRASLIKKQSQWVSRGPYNQPGCWQMAEFDETDNTVWGMTCAHYRGPRFIFKGSLHGDDFKLVSGKLPDRFNAGMVVVHPSTGIQRLLVPLSYGGISYTDDDGQTWHKSNGLQGNITWLIANRQNNEALYATDDQRIYVSTDHGVNFRILQDFGSAQRMALYSPRYSRQAGSANIYLTRHGGFYKLAPGQKQFTRIGNWSFQNYQRFSIGGDQNFLVISNGPEGSGDMLTSTDGGQNWHKTTGQSYPGFHYIATNPENPRIIVSGYMNPEFSSDGAESFLKPNIWWMHQIASPGNQDERSRVRIHADHQSTQFFYDKDGKLFTLHSTDGGLYRSYKDWTLTHESQWNTGPDYYPYKQPNEVYYNLTLYNTPTSEIYHPRGMARGYKNPDHIFTSTQDQGNQISSEIIGNKQLLRFVQSPYGDGSIFFHSNDHKTLWGQRWKDGHLEISKPFSMYDSHGNFAGSHNWQSGGPYYQIPGATGDTKYAPDVQNTNKLWFWVNTTLSSGTWISDHFDFKTFTLPGSGNLAGFAQSKQHPDTLYIIRGKTIYRSVNGGNNWSARNTIPASNTSLCKTWVSPIDYNRILFYCPSSSNKAVSWYSVDGGITLTDVSGVLPNIDYHDANGTAMVGTPDGRYVFIGTMLGPFVFDTQSNQWFYLLDNATPMFYATNIDYIASTNTVRFATWGLGIYDFKINGNVDTKIQWHQDSVALDGSPGEHSAGIIWNPITTTPNNDHDVTFTVTAAPGGATCTTTHKAGASRNDGNACELKGLNENTHYQVSVVPDITGYQPGDAGTVNLQTAHAIKQIQWNSGSVHTQGTPGEHNVNIIWNPITVIPNNNENVVFTVTATPGGATCTVTHNAGGTVNEGNTCQLQGLAAGTAYQVSVIPHAVGYQDGAAGMTTIHTSAQIVWHSDSVSVTHVQEHSATVNWDSITTLPNNTQDVTFKVTTLPASAGCQAIHRARTPASNGNSCQLTGLNDNTPYQVTVTPSSSGYIDGTDGIAHFTTLTDTGRVQITWHNTSVHIDGNAHAHDADIVWDAQTNVPDNHELNFVVTLNPGGTVCQIIHHATDPLLQQYTCHVSHLRVNTDYKIVVIPHATGYQDGNAGIVDLHTANEAPSPVTPPNNSGGGGGGGSSAGIVAGAGIGGALLAALLLLI